MVGHSIQPCYFKTLHPSELIDIIVHMFTMWSYLFQTACHFICLFFWIRNDTSHYTGTVLVCSTPGGDYHRKSGCTCVIACKIWPPFKKLLAKRYSFLWWNQEIVYSLKQPFSKSRKMVKTFQKTPIFKKTRKVHFILHNQESSKYGVKINPFLGGFHEISGKKHPRITIL